LAALLVLVVLLPLLALAWIATRFGWQANLWVLLAFAAGALACGVAIGAIENKIKA